MPNAHHAYAIAVELHQTLQALADTHPDLAPAIELSDQLAREMGWQWIKDGD